MKSPPSSFPPLPIGERTLAGRWSGRSCSCRGWRWGSGDHKLAAVSWCQSDLVQCDVPGPSSAPLSFKHYLILNDKGNKNQSDNLKERFVWKGEVNCEAIKVILVALVIYKKKQKKHVVKQSLITFFFPFIFWFYFNTPCDLLKVLPVSRSMSTPGTHKHPAHEFLVKLTTPIFPRSAPVTYIFLEF